MKKVVFTNEQIQEILDLYVNQEMGMSKIGKIYNVSKTVIARILKENNITHRNNNHIYKANYRIFKDIDSAEKAYWLGFFAADGYVYQRKENALAGNFCGINIHKKDKEHLEKLKKFMNSDVKIIDHIQTQGFSNDTPMSRIVFNSNDMVNDLIDKGVTPKKSLTLLPPNIQEKFFLPFILGYFDGDGSIFQDSHKNFGINIVGTKEVLGWINNILNISNKLEQRTITEKNNYYIRCGGNQKSYAIMKQLYNSVPVHLDRKYEIYKNLETVVLNRNIE